MTHNMPGRGRRQCPGCKQYVGVRVAKCDCGYEFVLAPAKPREPKPAEVKPVEAKARPTQQVENLQPSSNYAAIYAPGAGYPNRGSLCPVAPHSSSEEDVCSWIDELQDLAHHRNCEYAKSAIKYMANIFWPRYPSGSDPVNPEYLSVCKIIESHC